MKVRSRLGKKGPILNSNNVHKKVHQMQFELRNAMVSFVLLYDIYRGKNNIQLLWLLVTRVPNIIK